MNSNHPSNPPSRESSASSGTTGDASDGKSSQIMIPTPNELVSLLSKRVIGQEQAKQTIAVAVYQHFMNCARSDLLGGRVEVENNVLLIGPTGCGKSLLLRTLQDLLEIPLCIVSCTNITPDGYKGKNFVQHLDSIAEVIVDEGQTSPAIVVWDAFEAGTWRQALGELREPLATLFGIPGFDRREHIDRAAAVLHGFGL